MTVWQVDDFLAEMRFGLRRDDGAVGNDIIHITCAECAQIAEIMHLHGRRAQGKNTGPITAGMAAEIDRDTEIEASGKRGNLEIRFVAQVEESIKGPSESLLQGIVRLGTK